ncbi:uncharacterized protein BCR38DRAFT_412355 [Pseudomassariella vexata]|uniref:Uncharacterized protein n=1 Tax=Pseudomassariella vexata TaxID=1141098 RepID=A0A1Y2DLK7_9PEZI|nr:uncharacterized protein BCR38DRAFT_412355 [Pseudomassariella vexata]ORY60163.1 hypothetical protein BCR38DRAFT_412355 [Pseudomassariella vexata]
MKLSFGGTSALDYFLNMLSQYSTPYMFSLSATTVSRQYGHRPKTLVLKSGGDIRRYEARNNIENHEDDDNGLSRDLSMKKAQNSHKLPGQYASTAYVIAILLTALAPTPPSSSHQRNQVQSGPSRNLVVSYTQPKNEPFVSNPFVKDTEAAHIFFCG